MTDPELLAELERLDKAATKGPWYWRWCVGGKPELWAKGCLIVMDFVRSGMAGAVARFAKRDPTDEGGIMFPLTETMPKPAARNPEIHAMIGVPDADLMSFLGTHRARILHLLQREAAGRELLHRIRANPQVANTPGHSLLADIDTHLKESQQ
jgi:hypothetical protein